MKKIVPFFPLLLLFLLGAVSCKKDFLEIEPKGKLIAKSINDYDLLLYNLGLLNTRSNAQTPMGDEVIALDPYFSGAPDARTKRLFYWEDEIYRPNEQSYEMETIMTMLYTYNKIINEVMNTQDGTEQKKRSIYAEALVGRAWCNFMMINYYGKPYNPSTAATDPGFPIVTTSDVNQTKFTRASVKEVYDFIVKDLTTAIPDLPVSVISRLRATRPAGSALLGKVYVFMGKFAEALPLFNSALSDLASSTLPVRLYDYNITMLPGGIMDRGAFGPNYPTTVNNEENLYAKQSGNEWTFIFDDIILSPETAAKYTQSDRRLNFYTNLTYGGTPIPVPGALRRAGPGTIQFGMLLPDIYLLRAEVKARQDDLVGAKADLETLRAKRLPPGQFTVPNGLTKKQMIDFVLDERLREFAVHGYRWFDMRRLSVDPLYAGITYTHRHYTSGTTYQTITLRPERLTMRLPAKVIDQNPGMQNNP